MSSGPPHGTLELLILKTLALEPMHGWGIGERIQQMSGQLFTVNHGALYPALERLRRNGWVRAEWRDSENARRARYYALTRAGERQLAEARGEWERAVATVNLILGAK